MPLTYADVCLLLRYYSMPALLMHLDALEWEGLEAEREGDEDGQVLNLPALLVQSTNTDAEGRRGAPRPRRRPLRVVI
jgi:hypothetical protein